jgi:phosphoribosylamine--glycine ligase
MKVLIVGGGGREHALAWKISQSTQISKLYCAPGNGGTAGIATNIDIGAEDIDALAGFAQKEKIDLTVVGPEAPLVKGIVNLFDSKGLRVFGPSAKAAELEGSKIFMKEILQSAGVPTAEYEMFGSVESALAYLDTVTDYPVVVKADGLAAGKGVLVAPDRESAKKFVNDLMSSKMFGESGEKIIIEQCLKGEEASYIVIADGSDFVPLASSQDHKRVGDGDTGPNTGGMGAYSPAPVITPEIDEKIRTKIIRPLLDEMADQGRPFTGFLYAGLMIDGGEPSVLEFNVRFGDPETQPILARYKGDFLELLEAAIEGEISHVTPEWEEGSSVCVVMASAGYPGKYEKGKVIEGLEQDIDCVTVFHAGTAIKDGKVVTNGGRVLGVTAVGADIREAVDRAYKRVETIEWDGAFWRTDIASRALDR